MCNIRKIHKKREKSYVKSLSSQIYITVILLKYNKRYPFTLLRIYCTCNYTDFLLY